MLVQQGKAVTLMEPHKPEREVSFFCVCVVRISLETFWNGACSNVLCFTYFCVVWQDLQYDFVFFSIYSCALKSCFQQSANGTGRLDFSSYSDCLFKIYSNQKTFTGFFCECVTACYKWTLRLIAIENVNISSIEDFHNMLYCHPKANDNLLA